MAKTKQTKNGTVEKKLIGLADLVITAAQHAKDPTMAIPIRALSNVTFNERRGLREMGKKKQARSFFNVGMAKKFMQTMLARIIHERFCCNRGFAAATSLSAGGLAARSVNILFKDASLPHGSARPSRFATPQFRHEPS